MPSCHTFLSTSLHPVLVARRGMQTALRSGRQFPEGPELGEAGDLGKAHPGPLWHLWQMYSRNTFRGFRRRRGTHLMENLKSIRV